jgi:isopentenyldiphosphate isomerase
MASNPIPKINSSNEIIGVTTITDAFKHGWPRRVSRVIVTNEKGEYLLQKRSLESKIHPGVWDCSGGHVDVDETYTEAGAREVLEELGVDVVVESPSKPVLFENTFYVVCRAQIDSELVLTLQKHEVTEVMWASRSELLQMMRMHSGNFTPWVVHIWENSESLGEDAL